jgi:Actin interacting protein 3
VRLGYEFNLACRAFNSIGVETSDLGPVPDLLRTILEDTLSQPASPQSLDAYLPKIRDIIINLLHGLKRKQSKLRTRSNKDGGSGRSTTSSRQMSGTSLGSNDTGLTQMLDDVPSQAQNTMRDQKNDDGQGLEDQGSLPARNASAPITTDRHSALNRQSLQRDINRSVTLSDSSSSMSSTAMQNIPVLPPYSDPEQNQRPPESAFLHPPPPPPPPKQQDALAALQRGGELERRASRRFSSYQIQKHLGASPNGIPVIPAAQHSPIPNRGQQLRESREMMSAVKARGSYQHTRQKSNSRATDTSPSRNGQIKTSRRISEEREEDVGVVQKPPAVVIPPPSEHPSLDSPTTKTPEGMYKSADSAISPVGATLNGPPTLPGYSEILARPKSPAPTPPEHQQPLDSSERMGGGTVDNQDSVRKTPPRSQQFTLEDSPPPGKELTLFLQYKSKIKKFVLSEGCEGLTIARLQLAFIEKFAWNTHNNGVDLPEIYIQDPVSGVRHELEDLSDVKDRSVLVLNVEALDEVKKHFDEGISDLRKMLEGVRGVVDGQNTMMQRLGDRQLEASKEMARISVTPSRTTTHPTTPASGSSSKTAPSAASLSEVQSLRRDIAVLRQTYASMSSDFTASLDSIKAKGANVKSVAADAAVPTFEGNAGRAHVNKGKKDLAQESEALVNHVDDLSDIVEDLRKDVVTRGVRPLPRQLENISKDISATVKELAKMKEFLKREKPIWTKIWEQELNLVCTERDELTQQEDLMADLHGDLEDLTGVFKLVEEATKQQNLQNGTAAGGMRSTSRNISVDTDVDPLKAKDGVLGEVRALQPNHEIRLEAIERAEKLRQKELESRKGGDFQREVESFVEEGRLKKTGGADEVERLRKLKDERARRENWERAQQRKAEMEAQEAEEAAAAAAAAAAGPQHSQEDSTEGEAVFEDAAEHKSEAEPPNAEDEHENMFTTFAQPPKEQPVTENPGMSFLHD